MERFTNYGCVILAIVFISLNANIHAQPMTQNVNGAAINLPPLIFPNENATIGTGLPPSIFPKENATEGAGPPPDIFPIKSAAVIPLPALVLPKTTNFTGRLADVPPLIFPKKNGTIPLLELPPLIFPNDNKTFTVIPPTNETALNILNAKRSKKPILLPDVQDDDYYDEDSSSQGSDSSEQVEEVQPIDKNQQSNELEENYKSKTNPLSTDDLNDDTEVDHPMLKNTHIMGILAAALAALFACIYIGLTIWRRIIFNRYGMRERLVNEDDFYSNKSINRHF